MYEASEEMWCSVAGFEGKYEVSDHGRVRSLIFINKMCSKLRDVPKVLRQIISHGYKRVVLCRDNKCRMYMVHRLVAAAFIGPIPPQHEVNHKGW